VRSRVESVRQSCNGTRGRQPGIKTAPDRRLAWARALHSFAQLRHNRQNQLLFEVPLRDFENGRLLALLIFSNGAVGFKVDQMAKPHLREDQYQSSEVLIKAAKKGLRVGEVPIHISRR
jgi:hypothetical protein